MEGQASRLVSADETFAGQRISLRLVRLSDCTETYVGWLQNPDVNQYLETRWSPQTLSTVKEFVAEMERSRHSYLFAIIEHASGTHIGNIKVGPIVPHHGYADVSYFIGETSAWNKGYASEAIRLVTDISFERLGVYRLQAGLYESHTASAGALRKAGYQREGSLRQQLLGPRGREDHVWFGITRPDWERLRSSS